MGSLLDEHGSHARDSIHRELARVIQNNIRITDRLGRWDGDRFIVLAGAGSDMRRAKRVAERLRRKIEGGDFPGINASITASMAVTELNRGDNLDSLARRLQSGIDAALARGGNRVELATARGQE
jgi:diguanylate cyclase (GGDEF)-like protein